ncbi:helix-turn-helix domain-containing protein [Chryseobacterium populi]|uniref:DNA-binding domain-containing protein, AraC-type n=1 Tax=Chryseobacterium populi TaxID=1144316 RepID=J2KS86_9FLAO|nr:helix-turn-helix domain-containing protein [Chryseobacterium populi]EJL75918.1 DNA-binding domain-containing protein, AraC-type [Chryseobacterium populi]
MQYIVIIGAFQALVALWLLQFRERKSPSNYLFIFLLSAIAVHLTIKFVIFNFIPDESIRQQMNTFIGVCYGPLIYLYTLSKTKKGFSIAGKWYIFIPFFLLMIAYFTVSCVFIILNHADQKLLDLYNSFSLNLIFIINLYYPLKSVLIARKTRFKTLEKIEYDVITRISYCILLMELGVIVSKTLLYIYPEETQFINISIRSIAYFLLLVICLLIVRKSLKTEVVHISETDSEHHHLKISVNPNIDEDSLPLNIIDYEIKFNELWQKMDDSVKKQQLFRNCDLNLDELAIKTEINKYQISEMLNGYKQKPFYRYINEYRIEYFRKMVEKAIEKNEHINFLSFAYEAGFKSKSSFNRYFKEIIGKTPSEYYKSLINENKGSAFENLYRGSA